MKKIIILLAVFLIGTASVFAAPYEVIVSWGYISPFYCQSELSNEYEFKITLEIYDVVNDVQVTLTSNTENWDETETTFSAAQTGVEDWCDEATKTPNLRVTVLVEMVLISNPNNAYCDEYSTVYKTCGQFSSGAVTFNLQFN